MLHSSFTILGRFELESQSPPATKEELAAFKAKSVEIKEAVSLTCLRAHTNTQTPTQTQTQTDTHTHTASLS